MLFDKNKFLLPDFMQICGNIRGVLFSTFLNGTYFSIGGNIMYCSKCGKQILKESKFCHYCGTSVKTQNNMHSQIINNTEQMENVQKETVAASSTQTFAVRCDKCHAIYSSDMKSCPTCGADQKSNTLFEKEEKPKFSIDNAVFFAIGFIICLLGFLATQASEWSREDSISHGNGDPHFQGTFLILLGLAIIGIVIYCYFKKVYRYNLKMNSPEEYKKLIIAEQDRAIANQKAMQKAEQDRLALLPECPICKSKANVKRISNIDRSFSVAMIGLASSKIGKQYECTKCKHKW